MFRVLIRQAILGVLIVLTSLTLTFILVRFSGDPTAIILPQEASVEQREQLRENLGLNDSLPVQFFNYLKNAVHGDFGTSYFDSETVASVVWRHLPNTILLASASMFLACLISLPLGVISALRQGGRIDRAVQIIAVVGASMPSFWVGLLLIQIFAVGLNLFPTYGNGGLVHLVLPATTLALYVFPGLSRLTRASVLEVLPQHYVMTARAKGMPEYRVICRTVLRNALVPILTLLALEIGHLFGGAVLTETVFAWEGIGRLAITSIQRRDFPIVQGVVAYVAVGFVFITFIAEVSIRMVNPKLRHK